MLCSILLAALIAAGCGIDGLTPVYTRWQSEPQHPASVEELPGCAEQQWKRRQSVAVLVYFAVLIS